MSWNAENEVYRCMVDELVRMCIQEYTEEEMEKELAKRAEDIKDTKSQIAFVTDFSIIISRLWYTNKGD